MFYILCNTSDLRKTGSDLTLWECSITRSNLKIDIPNRNIKILRTYTIFQFGVLKYIHKKNVCIALSVTCRFLQGRSPLYLTDFQFKFSSSTSKTIRSSISCE